jgi:hypothetical protein
MLRSDADAIARDPAAGRLYPYTKTRQDRTVDLLAPLATDFAEWALANDRRSGLVMPRTDGQPWTRADWGNWRRRVYRRAVTPAVLSPPTCG